MDGQQLKGHYEALGKVILSRRSACRDEVKNLKSLLKNTPETEEDVRASIQKKLLSYDHELKKYSIPVTRIMPLRVTAPLDSTPHDFYYNGRAIQYFLKRLGKYVDTAAYQVNRNYNLEITYHTARSKGRLELVQFFIDGTAFADLQTLIPTMDMVE